MSIYQYRSLIDEICVLSLIPDPSNLYESANFTVNKVDFSLHHQPLEFGDQVAIYADMGPIPKGNRDDVLLSLLKINFYLFHDGQSPVFACNPETERALLMKSIHLDGTTALALLLTMNAFSQLIDEWRLTAFQETDSRASLPPVNKAKKSTSQSERCIQ